MSRAQLHLLDAPRNVDERHHPTLEALCVIYREARGESLVVTGRTARDVAQLLAHATKDFGPDSAPVEVVRRWRLALAASYPRTSTPGELYRNWGHFAPSLAFDPNEGILR